ncbi:phosphoribosylaminoimidazolesuccinocarboxamide synthase [Natronospora cellulosivora (SeqCode)]
MNKKNLLYEGKAKQIYTCDDQEKLIVYFKDDATAFNGEKKGEIKNKGILNNKISNIFFDLLEDKGVKTHLLEIISENEVLVKKLEIIPLEVVVRNIVAGSLVKRLGIDEGTELEKTVLEFYYKDDDLGDPMINEYHIYAKDLASEEEIKIIIDLSFKINKILKEYLIKKNINLVDLKLEFGKDSKGKIYLGDEISPDNCRFWDSKSGKKLDKDRFRKNLGEVENAYQEIYNRLRS